MVIFVCKDDFFNNFCNFAYRYTFPTIINLMKVLANIFDNVDCNDPENAGSPVINVFNEANNLSFISLPKKNTKVVSVVCLSGSARFTLDMREIVLPAKSISVLLPGHLIESYSTSDDFKGFMITSSQRNFESFLPVMSKLFLCSMFYRDNPVIELDDRELENQILFHDLLQNKLNEELDTFNRLVVNRLVEGIFCETCNIFFKRLNMNFSARCNRSETLFYRFIVDIESNFKTERSVSFYAEKLCVTPKHLSSVIKEISGRTASECIDLYVVSEIKRLLATTDMNIQEISCSLNFANQSFFGKYFKTHTGYSPREYRNLQYK